MQYIGVARKNKGGFVQVGFEPKRLMEAQSRNTYDYIFAKLPTDVGEELFVGMSSDIPGTSDRISVRTAISWMRFWSVRRATIGRGRTAGGSIS